MLLLAAAAGSPAGRPGQQHDRDPGAAPAPFCGRRQPGAGARRAGCRGVRAVAWARPRPACRAAVGACRATTADGAAGGRQRGRPAFPGLAPSTLGPGAGEVGNSSQAIRRLAQRDYDFIFLDVELGADSELDGWRCASTSSATCAGRLGGGDGLGAPQRTSTACAAAWRVATPTWASRCRPRNSRECCAPGLEARALARRAGSRRAGSGRQRTFPEARPAASAGVPDKQGRPDDQRAASSSGWRQRAGAQPARPSPRRTAPRSP